MSIVVDNKEAWIAALRRAALEDAHRVEFGRETKSVMEVSYTLNSYDADGEAMGDDRDYDLLKAVFSPLERLSETMPDTFMIKLTLGLDELEVD